MSTTLYLATNPALNNVELNSDRVFLATLVANAEEMDALCNRLGVASLSGFQSYDPSILGAYIDDPDELREAIAKAPPVEWFKPADALPTVKALRDHYAVARGITSTRSTKSAGEIVREQIDRTDDLLDELEDLDSVLNAVAKANAKFRIYVGE